MQRYVMNVTGHVQGVGFRYHVQREANRRKLSGIVKNLANGDVHIEVQGEQAQILELKRYMLEAIPFAEVTAIAMSEVELRPGETGFKVKY